MTRCALVVLLAAGSAVARNPTTAGSPTVPFSFVENRGQADRTIRYIGSGSEFKAWFQDLGVIFQQGASRLGVHFAEANTHPAIEISEPLGATANYFHGPDQNHWQTGLPLYKDLCYRGVWNGIDVRFTAEGSKPAAEYVLAPGASIGDIRLRFDGSAAIQRDGSLIVRSGPGQFREDKPFVFQQQGEKRLPVTGGYVKYPDGTIGFNVGDYDRAKILVVDPTIMFSGYMASSSQTNITAVAVNSYYNIVVAGWTTGTDLPASGGAQPGYAGGVDAFVAEFSASGGTLIYCTYLGGSGDDRAFGLAVDSFNNTYITGWTSSTNFPRTNPLQSKLGGTRDAFVTKLNAAGNALIFSTYLGGSGVDAGNAIALDSSNDPVITGDTTSTNLAVTPGAFQSKSGGGQDVFVAKLTAAGNALSFMTYLGGTATDHGAALKLDSSNAIYLAGSTYSTNFPVLNAFQPHSGGGQDGFVTKMSSDGRAIVFSTYYGGSGGSAGAPEEINGLALSPSGAGSIYVAGTTSSTNLPIANAVQPTFGGGSTDGFWGRLSSSTGALQRSSYLGGSSDDGINAITVGLIGDAYLAGYTTSTDFPTQGPIQQSPAGAMDAFVVKITQNGVVLFSTYLGGSANDSANAIAIDSMTSIVVAGSSGSSNFPTAGNVGSWPGSSLGSFLTKLAPNFRLALADAPAFLLDVWHDTGYNGPTLNMSISSFGQAGDLPVAGDWTGTGIKRIGVFRNGTWYLDINGDGVFDAGDKTISFGQAGDVPVVGDWNGTGQIKLGLYRQGTFILDLSGHLSGVPTGLSDLTFPFGLSSDIPVANDWNQSGTTKVRRVSTCLRHLEA